MFIRTTTQLPIRGGAKQRTISQSRLAAGSLLLQGDIQKQINTFYGLDVCFSKARFIPMQTEVWRFSE